MTSVNEPGCGARTLGPRPGGGGGGGMAAGGAETGGGGGGGGGIAGTEAEEEGL